MAWEFGRSRPDPRFDKDGCSQHDGHPRRPDTDHEKFMFISSCSRTPESPNADAVSLQSMPFTLRDRLKLTLTPDPTRTHYFRFFFIMFAWMA